VLASSNRLNSFTKPLPQVVPGELTIVTGLPNSGKSEWIDALAVNLARREGWRIALCSLENSAKEHGRKLMEKYIGGQHDSAAAVPAMCTEHTWLRLSQVCYLLPVGECRDCSRLCMSCAASVGALDTACAGNVSKCLQQLLCCRATLLGTA
jgi:hypothetical protein